MSNTQLWEILTPVLVALAGCIVGIITAFRNLLKSKQKEVSRCKEVCEWANKTIGALKIITSKDKEGNHTHDIKPDEMICLEEIVTEGEKLDIKNYKEK